MILKVRPPFRWNRCHLEHALRVGAREQLAAAHDLRDAGAEHVAADPLGLAAYGEYAAAADRGVLLQLEARDLESVELATKSVPSMLARSGP